MSSATRVLFSLLALLPATGLGALQVVIVQGLGGEPRYAEQFAEQARAAESAALSLTDEERVRVFDAAEATRDSLLAHFASLVTSLGSDDQLVVYLIGHGSYDEYQYKFNVAGPDMADADIAAVLDALPSKNQVLINTSSASGSATDKLRADGRIVISATRSGVERHATRFGGYFTAALLDPAADLDKNGMISAQEAFDFADRKVADFFAGNGQLATEHPQLDGERADRFSLARLGAPQPAFDDGSLRELIVERDRIAARIESLRLAKGELPADEYQQELLSQMLELALAEEAIEIRQQELGREN